jgi:hypothetical protein
MIREKKRESTIGNDGAQHFGRGASSAADTLRGSACTHQQQEGQPGQSVRFGAAGGKDEQRHSLVDAALKLGDGVEMRRHHQLQLIAAQCEQLRSVQLHNGQKSEERVREYMRGMQAKTRTFRSCSWSRWHATLSSMSSKNETQSSDPHLSTSARNGDSMSETDAGQRGVPAGRGRKGFCHGDPDARSF